MAWLAQHLGLGQTAAANSLGIATPMPGSGVFAGPPTSAQGGAATAGTGSPSLPSGITPAQAQQVAYWTSQGVDPSTALMMATMSGQQPSALGLGIAGAGTVANDVLEARLRPELASPAPAVRIETQPAGPLPFAGNPLPNPSVTTDAMIAALL